MLNNLPELFLSQLWGKGLKTTKKKYILGSHGEFELDLRVINTI